MLNIKRQTEKYTCALFLKKDFSMESFNRTNCRLGTRTYDSHGFQDGSLLVNLQPSLLGILSLC